MVSTSDYSSTPVQLAAQVAIGTVLSLLCLITLLGNTLVIHAVRTDRKLQTVSLHIAACVYAYCVVYRTSPFQSPQPRKDGRNLWRISISA